mgnify:CR=1 FL=1
MTQQTDMQLTPHFKLSEIAGTTVVKYQKKNLEEAQKQLGKMYMLAGFGERVREIIGRPLLVTSGYRCVSLNNYLGGALISQHLKGEALDMVCRTLSVKSMYNRIKASDLKYDQMIIEKNKSGAEWLHISIGSRMQRLKFEDGTYTYLD